MNTTLSQPSTAFFFFLGEVVDKEECMRHVHQYLYHCLVLSKSLDPFPIVWSVNAVEPFKEETLNSPAG